jgi:hypothetical protein
MHELTLINTSDGDRDGDTVHLITLMTHIIQWRGNFEIIVEIPKSLTFHLLRDR